MIQCGTHDDYDDPPRVPMITGILPKRHKKESIADALTAAATAVAKAFSPPSTSQVATASSQMPCTSTVGMSPGKSIELRMENLQQLRNSTRRTYIVRARVYRTETNDFGFFAEA